MSCNNSSSQVRKEIQNNLPSDPVVGKFILYIMSSPGLIPWKTQLQDIQHSMNTPVLGSSLYSMSNTGLIPWIPHYWEVHYIPCPILDLFHEYPITGKFIILHVQYWTYSMNTPLLGSSLYSMSNTGLIPWKETNHIHQATRLWDLISSNTSVQENYLKQSTPGPFRPWQATCTQNYIQNSFVYKYMKVSYRNNSPKSTNQHFNKSLSSKTLFNKML